MTEIRNALDGHAHFVVQAGHIGGDVHLHGVPTVPPPRMVRPASAHFTNQVRVLGDIDRAWADADPARPPVIVLTGLPGVGKSEVARAWIAAHTAEFPDGQFHADLSGGQDGLESTVLREFLLEIGRPSESIPDTAEGRAAAWRSWSTDRRVAVVVDQPLTPSQVRMLLPGPGPSAVLVTASARPHGLGTHERVAVVDLAPLEDPAARELLRRVANRTDTDALVDFCAGLPIALCVAGATLAAYPNRSTARLVRDLEDRRRRLAALSKTPDLSVAAVFDNAYDRLDEPARRCYHLLGAHPGTGDVHPDTVTAVLGEDGIDDLLDAGLVQESPDGRLSMHALVRLHAGAKADPALLGAILDHYHHVGVAAGHAAMPGRPWRDRLAPHLAEHDPLAPADPLDWLTAERVNLLATLTHAADAGKPDCAWELALLLWPLHERGKYLDDLAAAARAGAGATDRAEVSAILAVQEGFAHLLRDEPAPAYTLFERAAHLATAPDLVATATESRGLAALADNRPDAAALLRDNLTQATAIGDPRRLALAGLHLAKACAPDEAITLLTDARAHFAGSEPVNAAKCDLWLGIVLHRAGRPDDAVAHLSAALTAMRGRPYDEAHVLTVLGDVAGTGPDAVDCYRRALVICETHGYAPRARELRGKLAELDSVDGRPETQ